MAWHRQCNHRNRIIASAHHQWTQILRRCHNMLNIDVWKVSMTLKLCLPHRFRPVHCDRNAFINDYVIWFQLFQRVVRELNTINSNRFFSLFKPRLIDVLIFLFIVNSQFYFLSEIHFEGFDINQINFIQYKKRKLQRIVCVSYSYCIKPMFIKFDFLRMKRKCWVNQNCTTRNWMENNFKKKKTINSYKTKSKSEKHQNEL